MGHRNCQVIVFYKYEMLRNLKVPIWLEGGKRPADSQKTTTDLFHFYLSVGNI